MILCERPSRPDEPAHKTTQSSASTDSLSHPMTPAPTRSLRSPAPQNPLAVAPRVVLRAACLPACQVTTAPPSATSM